MSRMKWILLGVLFAIYLLFGGVVFMVIEQKHEIQQNADFLVLRQDVKEILLKLDLHFYRNETPASVIDSIKVAKEAVIGRISESCGGHNLLEENDDDDRTLRWTFYNSVFFAFTVVTTIGYGNLSPTVYLSRVFTIIYALFGIPINGILISGLSNYFSRKLVIAHKRSKEDGSARDKSGARLAFIFDITFYLIPGLLVFMVIPAGFFVVIENWTFLDSIYFSFVTLTTIGFGDYVAGMGDGHGFWLWLYKVILILWIILGMGYFVMILSFITKGMTHKKVRVIINKRLNQVRTTKDKLARDIEYMRRIVNELYMMKIKPVYNDEEDKCSDISSDHYCIGDRSFSTPNCHRSNRSLNLPILIQEQLNRNNELKRRHSDTDLNRIDREKTFEEAIKKAVLPNELLATVVNMIQNNVHQMIDNANNFEDDDNEDGIDLGVIEYQQQEPDEIEEIGPPWELGMVDESDEDDDVLIDDDDGNQLEEVIVHSSASANKPATSSILHTSQIIHKKVSEMIRKISAGSRESEGPSRKISPHSNAETKKISYHPAAKDGQFKPLRKISDIVGRKISSTPTDQSPLTTKRTGYKSQPRDVSANLLRSTSEKNLALVSHGERLVWGRDNTSRHHDVQSGSSGAPISQYLQNIISREEFLDRSKIKSIGSLHMSSSAPSTTCNSRKISREKQFDNGDPHSHCNNNYELDHTTLVDLLRALDTVHGRLKGTESSDKISKSATATESPSGNPAAGTSKDYQSSEASTTSITNPASAQARSRTIRTRKLGVFNPDFSFINESFQNTSENNLPSKIKPRELCDRP